MKKPPVTYICKNCGTQFEATKPRKYCNRMCQTRFITGIRAKKP